MAYTTPTTKNVGDAIKKEDFDIVRTDLDDHESRINSVEANLGQIEILNLDFRISSSGSALTGAIHFPCPRTMTLTECFVQIYEKGSLTGTLEIDVKKNTTQNNTGMTSVFSTKPSISFASTSDYAKSTNAVFNVSQSTVTKDDIIRLDITSLPGNGSIGKFLVVLRGEV